ncbi:phenazine biosynthesis protein phzE [Streptomyces sp. SLBN-118]|uniref:anthranilate synthase family protein n=1 Tax=Streptomyces sp. SLBN-118 TaxID=2768454 RepID=UPI001154BE9F|nr:anthranilate synthase family protein [Streptomyces sp. SLBN-118]TQK42785.1 phenazine biosynthesis protein phzE [Streptomyces sp. SLBN-118]
MSTLLDRILRDPPPAYAILHRPHTTDPGQLDILTGNVTHPVTLARIPLPRSAPAGRGRHETLVLVPYRQITERGFSCHDDHSPLISMAVTEQQTMPLGAALARLPDVATSLSGGHFDSEDATYAQTVKQVITDEIGTGAGANFVIQRSFVADITDYGPHGALAFFRRLLEGEEGAYWTFVVHTGSRTFVGASPERHISVRGATAVMNPISGTYRYPAAGPTLAGVMDFLADAKESDELCMVVDEELKMMAGICEPGISVLGPYLKEMARLAHSEYYIRGRTARDVRTILRETLLAPTVTGGPLESACRVIARYEKRGRGYYSGIAALIGRDEQGGRILDSAILIRSADISAAGRVRIGVGSTLVRHSDPGTEAAETRAKAAGLIAALESGPATSRPTRTGAATQSGTVVSYAAHPSVRAALERRNDTLASFWLHPGAPGDQSPSDLAGRTALVIDMEDTFTSMIAHQLRSLGLVVTVRRFDEAHTFDGCDLVVLGPGPGDPAERGHPRMEALRSAVHSLLAQRRPFLAVCLSHQVLSLRLGFSLQRRDHPSQGAQHEIDFFGDRVRAGFYNTYAAHSRHDTTHVDGVGRVDVSRDRASGEVHALRGPHFTSMQFHPESVLTEHGVRIVAQAVRRAMRPAAVPA